MVTSSITSLYNKCFLPSDARFANAKVDVDCDGIQAIIYLMHFSAAQPWLAIIMPLCYSLSLLFGGLLFHYIDEMIVGFSASLVSRRVDTLAAASRHAIVYIAATKRNIWISIRGRDDYAGLPFQTHVYFGCRRVSIIIAILHYLTFWDDLI